MYEIEKTEFKSGWTDKIIKLSNSQIIRFGIIRILSPIVWILFIPVLPILLLWFYIDEKRSKKSTSKQRGDKPLKLIE